MVDGLSLTGGYEGSGSNRDTTTYITTIDARMADGGSPADHVVFMESLTHTRLDGFTITGGVANGFEPHNFGGGIYITNLDASNTM